MRRFFSAGIIVVWLVLVGMLIAEQNAPLDEHRRLAPMAGEGGARDEWFGVYREEHKVGWVHRTLSRSPEGWIVRDDSELRLAMLGTAQRLRTSLIAETDETFGLRRFRFGLVSPAATLALSVNLYLVRPHLKKPPPQPFPNTSLRFKNRRGPRYIMRRGL